MTDDKPGVLTDEDVDTILLAFLTGRGEDGFTLDEAEKVLNECAEWRMRGAMIDLVLAGRAFLDWDEERSGVIIKVRVEDMEALTQ